VLLSVDNTIYFNIHLLHVLEEHRYYFASLWKEEINLESFGGDV
jgi:hypothetical protein